MEGGNPGEGVSVHSVRRLHRVERHKVAPGKKHQKQQDTIAATDNRRRSATV